MSDGLESEMAQDQTAASAARAIATANRRAKEMGFQLESHSLSVEQLRTPEGIVWHINNVPDNAPNQRGGGCVIDVNATNGTIQ